MPELIQQVNIVSNSIFHVVDFWLDSILGGYTTEFTIDATQYYSTMEREFFKGTWRVFKIIVYIN
jgi:hypothetical protein